MEQCELGTSRSSLGKLLFYLLVKNIIHIKPVCFVGHRRHLPGAVFLDMFEGAEHTDLILRNVPDMSKFEASLQEAGVNQNSHVIVYDSEGRSGFYAAARAAWQMKVITYIFKIWTSIFCVQVGKLLGQ